MTALQRSIRHPGPVAATRWKAIPCRAETLRLRLRAGRSVNEAAAAAFSEAGYRSGYLRLRGAKLSPMHYVIPAVSPDGANAAWYSATHSPEGVVEIEDAGLIVGRRDGGPFLHCHGIWRLADGNRRMGHLLPIESMLVEDVEVDAIGISGAHFEAAHDPETNFKLFAPVSEPAAAEAGRRAVALRIRPNIDLGEAITLALVEAEIEAAEIHGIGSLVGADFDDGRHFSSFATEVLVAAGHVVATGGANIAIALVGLDGSMEEGRLAENSNPVCVTFELIALETDDVA